MSKCKFIYDMRVALVTCKNNNYPIKNEGAGTDVMVFLITARNDEDPIKIKMLVLTTLNIHLPNTQG